MESGEIGFVCPCEVCTHRGGAQLQKESVNPQSAYWRHNYKIPGTRWTLSGHSRALERSGFFIKELKIFLDAGVAFHNSSNGNSHAILVTHTHIDHINALPMLLRVGTSADPAIVVPRAHINGVREFTRLSWGFKGEDGSERAGCRVNVELKPMQGLYETISAEDVSIYDQNFQEQFRRYYICMCITHDYFIITLWISDICPYLTRLVFEIPLLYPLVVGVCGYLHHQGFIFVCLVPRVWCAHVFVVFIL